MGHVCEIPALRRLKQEDQELEATLGHVSTLSQKQGKDGAGEMAQRPRTLTVYTSLKAQIQIPAPTLSTHGGVVLGHL